MSVVIGFSVLAQKTTSVKSFEYPNYLCPSPYTGRPIYGGNTLEISYSSKLGSYGIDFKYGFIRYMLSLSYKGAKNGWHSYTGFEINNMSKVVVMTRAKLERYLDNFGQIQDARFEKDKLIEIHISGSGSLSIYPIKDTPEGRKERQERETRIKEENRSRDVLNKLYSYWQGIKVNIQDSLRNSFKKEFFEKKGSGVFGWDSEANFAVRYMVCVDSNKVVKVLKINDMEVDANIRYLENFNKYEYKPQAKNSVGAKLIKGKLYLTERFSPNLTICTLNREIVLEKGKVLYNRWGTGSVSQKAEKVINSNIGLLKKGRYLIEIQELDGELISIIAKKKSNISNQKEIKLYSIYE